MDRPDLDAIGESVARAAFAQPFDEIAYLRARLAETTEIARALETERDRLALTLRCERGEWAPEGWKWAPDRLAWYRYVPGWPRAVAEVSGQCAPAFWRWHLWTRTAPADEYGHARANWALEAIEAADAALREVAGG